MLEKSDVRLQGLAFWLTEHALVCYKPTQGLVKRAGGVGFPIFTLLPPPKVDLTLLLCMLFVLIFHSQSNDLSSLRITATL